MNESILNQAQYQQRLLASLDIDPVTLPGVRYAWWYNPTNPQSLRLTKLGHKWFNQVAKITCYYVSLEDHMILPRQLLQLERLLTSPYYIQTLKKLWVYGESDYVMLQLHAGDLPLYLNNMESHGG